MNLSSELKKNDAVFVSVSSNHYSDRFVSFAAELAKAYPLICVVSLDLEVAALSRALKAAGADPKKLLIVGAKCAHQGKCAVLSPGQAECDGSIVDLTTALYGLVDTANPKAILMGPLSVLAAKNSRMEALKFVSYVVDDSRKAKRKFVLICSCKKEDARANCAKDVELFVDKVLEEK
mgnify:CR=1 FL=1